MKCPECIKEGKKSTISIGSSVITAMPVHRFYGEDGKYHEHDPNVRSTQYRCSNGHGWVDGENPKCWCEVAKEDEAEA